MRGGDNADDTGTRSRKIPRSSEPGAPATRSSSSTASSPAATTTTTTSAAPSTRSTCVTTNVQELRVAAQELQSGRTTGRVFVQLVRGERSPSVTGATSRSIGATNNNDDVPPPRRRRRQPAASLPPVAALRVDRDVAQARVSRQLHSCIHRDNE